MQVYFASNFDTFSLFFPNATNEGVTWDEFQVICIGRTPCVGNLFYTINQEPSDGLLYKLCILGKSR